VPASTIFFVGDKFHNSQTAASVHSVSSTANGYNKEAVRDTSWLQAWKPSDGTGDEYLQVDGGSATWIGNALDTAYLAIAYDARGCDQNTITLFQDAADNPAGAFATLRSTFTVNKTAPTVDYLSFVISTSGRRYYRIYQKNADRGGGTKVIPIYAIAFFSAAEVYDIDANYTSDAPGPGGYSLISTVGQGQTAGGLIQTNKNGRSYQEFDVTFDKATATLFDALNANFLNWEDGPARSVWLQYEGIVNAAKADFGMVKVLGQESSRQYVDQNDMSLRVRTMTGPI
jgi:hypothetical protein